MKKSGRFSILAYSVVFSVVFLAAPCRSETEAEGTPPPIPAPLPPSTPVPKKMGPQGSLAPKPSTMVFDPQTKKYFIGGHARFMLKQADASSPIDRIEVSVDSAEYVPYAGAVQFQTEGKHTIKFRAINPVNTWSPVQFTEVFVDLVAPTSEATFTDGKFYKGEDGAVFAALNSTITLNAQDNLSGVGNTEWAWDGATTYSPYTRPILVERTGRHTLYFRSSDRVGNDEEAKSLDVVADGGVPQSEVKVVGGALKPVSIQGKSYLTATDSVSFAFTAKDDLSGVKHIWTGIDGKPAALYIKPIYFLQEGPHTISYFSEDQVGNKEPSRTISVYTVSTPPRTNATPIGAMVNTGGIQYAKPDLTLKLEATDNLVGLERIEWRNDKEPAGFHTYLEPIRFVGAGIQTISFRAVDRVGNVEPSRSFTVFLTDTPPQTTLETAQPLVMREGVVYSPAPNIVTLNVKSNGVGVKDTLVDVNDAGFKPYSGPITLTADRRQHKLQFKSVDKLGNEESPQTVTYHMIGAMPMVDLFISNDQNKEEQIRTQYFEGGGAARGTASVPGSGKAGGAKSGPR